MTAQIVTWNALSQHSPFHLSHLLGTHFLHRLDISMLRDFKHKMSLRVLELLDTRFP